MVTGHPTPVRQPDGSILLDENFAAQAPAMMKELGAVNVDGPLPRSAFLKNIKTGVVLPWSPTLAEMRDIMVNCDAQGNTDPQFWQASVNPQPYSEEEHQALLEQAYSSLTAAGYAMHSTPSSVLNEHVDEPMPYGAQPLADYNPQSRAAMDNLSQLLE